MSSSDFGIGGAVVLAQRVGLDVDCPECGAPAGELCVRSLLAPSSGRPSHLARRRASDERRRNGEAVQPTKGKERSSVGYSQSS